MEEYVDREAARADVNSGDSVREARGTMAMGLLAETEGDMDGSREWYLAVVDSDDGRQTPRALSALARISLASNRIDDARTWFERLIERDDAAFTVSATRGLAKLEHRHGDVDRAYELYTGLASGEDAAERERAVMALAQIDQERRDLRSARERYERLLRFSEDQALRARASMNLAILSQEQGDDRRAAELYRDVVEIGDQRLAPRAMVNLALILSTDDPGQAEDLLVRAARSSNPDSAARAMVQLAKTAVYRKRYHEAQTWLRQAVQGEGVINDAATGDLGVVEHLLGHDEEAIRLLRLAAHSDAEAVAQQAKRNLDRILRPS